MSEAPTRKPRRFLSGECPTYYFNGLKEGKCALLRMLTLIDWARPHTIRGERDYWMTVTITAAEANRLDTELGLKVRLRRRTLGLSQTQLAESVGLTFQQIQKYERGANRISFSMLIGIARALDCAPIDLIGDIGTNGHVPLDTDAGSASFRGQKVVELLEAFGRIKSPALRRQTIQLVKQLSKMPLAN